MLQPGRVPAAARAVALLRYLASTGRPSTASAMAKALSLPRTSVLGICDALADDRMLVRLADGRFWLGSHVLELAAASTAMLGRPLGVGLLIVSRANSFYTAMLRAATREMSAAGGQLLVRDAQESPRTQRDQWHELIDDGADIIIIDSVDAGTHTEELDHARRAGVPVIAIGSRLDGVDMSVTSDNTQAGLLAGRRVAEVLRGRGRVAILDGLRKNANIDRVAGFREAIRDSGGIEIAAYCQEEHDTSAAGQRMMARVLADVPDVDAVFAVCDPIAMGAAAAQRDTEAAIPIVSVDGRSDAVDDIVSGGPLIASVAQDPARLITAAITIGRELARGRSLAQRAHLIPVRIIDADNAEGYERWG
ncbi:substrate-binding domain-containing protein [Microbacterium halotolerans]|uniref:substrate-binding domain-containing protein n=1 Tax=Microbacterium halotolerans TaxID=246613 RepID=UPI001F09C173|nr:substrate-binding domain-containing protein [Microbacterium halotolerans]